MITLFWTVLFCLGLRIISDDGQLLGWIRKYFEGLENKIINLKEFYKFHPKHRLKLLFWQLQLFIATPVILCITCMASVWGVSVFVALNGFNIDLIPQLILNSFAASFIQTFIWSFYVRHIQ